MWIRLALKRLQTSFFSWSSCWVDLSNWASTWGPHKELKQNKKCNTIRFNLFYAIMQSEQANSEILTSQNPHTRSHYLIIVSTSWIWRKIHAMLIWNIQAAGRTLISPAEDACTRSQLKKNSWKSTYVNENG